MAGYHSAAKERPPVILKTSDGGCEQFLKLTVAEPADRLYVCEAHLGDGLALRRVRQLCREREHGRKVEIATAG